MVYPLVNQKNYVKTRSLKTVKLIELSMVHGFHLTQENVTKKVRILDVVYNATSNELVPCLAVDVGVTSKNRPRNWALL